MQTKIKLTEALPAMPPKGTVCTMCGEDIASLPHMKMGSFAVKREGGKTATMSWQWFCNPCTKRIQDLVLAKDRADHDAETAAANARRLSLLKAPDSKETDSGALFSGGKLHLSEELYRQMNNDMIGVCLACGAERDSCEPDARKYDCPECGLKRVYGVEELLQMGLVEFTEEV